MLRIGLFFVTSLLSSVVLTITALQHDDHNQMGHGPDQGSTTPDPHAGHAPNDVMPNNDVMSHQSDSSHQAMYFFASTNTTILFLDWTTSSWNSLLIACVGIFVLSLFYEALNAFSLYISRLSVTARKTSKQSSCGKAIYLHLLQSLLHVITIIIGYLLMLVVMTFNVWLFIPIVSGCGLGYVVIRWKMSTSRIPDTNEQDLTDLNEMKQCH